MAKQYLNTELLEEKKAKLESHKSNIVDYLTQIKQEYLKLIKNDLWLGNRSDVFFQSLKAYWDKDIDPSYAEAGGELGVIGQITQDFNNMILFITEAINKSMEKDENAANEIAQETGAGVAGERESAETNNSENEKENSAGASTGGSIPTVEPSNTGNSRNVSTGGFYPDENNNENNYVAGLNYQIINTDGSPARNNIGKETIKINGKDYQVYTYDDPKTTEKEHYIIGALVEDGKNSRPTGKVYTIDYGNGDVYEFVDLDTNATTRSGNERTPRAATDTYVDILSVRGQAYNNVGIESREPVKISDTGKVVSRT